MNHLLYLPLNMNMFISNLSPLTSLYKLQILTKSSMHDTTVTFARFSYFCISKSSWQHIPLSGSLSWESLYPNSGMTSPVDCTVLCMGSSQCILESLAAFLASSSSSEISWTIKSVSRFHQMSPGKQGGLLLRLQLLTLLHENKLVLLDAKISYSVGVVMNLRICPTLQASLGMMSKVWVLSIEPTGHGSTHYTTAPLPRGESFHWRV